MASFLMLGVARILEESRTSLDRRARTPALPGLADTNLTNVETPARAKAREFQCRLKPALHAALTGLVEFKYLDSQEGYRGVSCKH